MQLLVAVCAMINSLNSCVSTTPQYVSAMPAPSVIRVMITEPIEVVLIASALPVKGFAGFKFCETFGSD
jgi:hypothetical protein